jgi:glucose-specific phosphotransferase system IIA component
VSILVLAPLTGTLAPLAQVPDPVFAAELVGAGLAVEPVEGGGPAAVVSPVGGRIVKLHPHAFVVQAADGTGVLVHLGIDTVRLRGQGFRIHVREGDAVEAGRLVTTFDPDAVRAGGLSAICPVVILDSAPGSVVPRAENGPVDAGAVLFTWPPDT